MDGMSMMLKSMGIDPEKIKATAEQLQQMVKAIFEKLQAIEKQNSEILLRLQRMEETRDNIWRTIQKGEPLPLPPNGQPNQHQ